MLIPVKCFTCNNLLGNKWNTYKSEKEKLEKEKEDSNLSDQEIIDKTAKIVNESLDKKSKVCGVGISSLRALESSISSYFRLKTEKN